MEDLMARPLPQTRGQYRSHRLSLEALLETHPVIKKAWPPLLGASRDIDSSTDQVERRRPADIAHREITKTI